MAEYGLPKLDLPSIFEVADKLIECRERIDFLDSKKALLENEGHQLLEEYSPQDPLGDVLREKNLREEDVEKYQKFLYENLDEGITKLMKPNSDT